MIGVGSRERQADRSDGYLPDSLVELEAVGRRYMAGEAEVIALAGVWLRVSAEEFVVVLGPSGSGKTTLLNIIGALDSPSEGRVVVAGQDITDASRKDLFEFGAAA